VIFIRHSFMSLLRLLRAFWLRDWQEQTSYRAAMLFSFVGIFFRAFTFFFIAQLIGQPAQQALPEYGGDYFAFVLLGIAFNSYFDVGLTSFARSLRQAQTTGTLEAILMTPTPVGRVVLGSAMWSYSFTTLRVVVYLILGFFLGLDLSQANAPLALLGLLLSIAAFASIGIFAASIIMVIKRGDPITSLISSVSALLGGIYYPITLLPDWLQPLSYFLPITYGLNLMRQTLLNGASWTAVQNDFLILLGFTAILLPISLFTFRLAVNRARRDGSLAQY